MSVANASMRDDLGDDVEVAARVQLHVDVGERLQPRPELAAGAAHTLGHRAHQPVLTGEQGDDPVGLAELVLAQHHRPVPVQPHRSSLPSRRDRSGYPRRWFAVMVPPRAAADRLSHMPLARAFPTLTDQLYQLASGAVTSDELVRRSLHAIDASQPTLNAFRVVLTELGAGRRRRGRPATRGRGHAPLLGVPIAVKDDVDVAGVPTAFGTDGYVPAATADAEVVRRLRAAGAVIVGKTNTCELGQWPFTSGPASGTPETRGRASTRRAARRAAAPRRWPPAWSPRRSAPTARAASASRRPGPTWSASNPSAAASPPGRCPRRSTASRSTACWPAPSPTRRWCSTPPSGNVDGDLHRPPPVTAVRLCRHGARPAAHRGVDAVPVHRVPRHGCIREIRAALGTVAEQLADLGHTVMAGNPDYGLRLSWSFLSRSTAGLVDWADRIGNGVTLDARTQANVRLGRLLSQQVLRRARAHEEASRRRVGSIFDAVDVVLAPTTAQPPPNVNRFDTLGGTATDRAMIAACPVTWPWNVLGWPSINVPAGFTSDGLPIGVQLMGPENSEPLLVSLAAELEAVSDWSSRQPEHWWAPLS